MDERAPSAPGSFFGIDLAWSDRNPSAGCVLDHRGRVLDESQLGGDDDIADWVASRLSGPAVLAIDAPLRVPNEAGRRPCEAAVQRRYGARHAGPHPANRSLLRRVHGRVRDEDLAGRLAVMGFGDPWRAGDRTLLEVYPHPGLVEVFALTERLPYKRKRGMTTADQRRGLRRLRRLLGTLASADPPLIGDHVVIARALAGAGLKAVEDRLDARFCAWAAAAWARHGTARVALFGDPESGHIAVPQGRFDR